MPFENYDVDSDENSDFIYNFIEKVVNKFGPRLPCSEKEKETAKYLKSELGKYCDTAETEQFTLFPNAFLGWFKIVVPTLLIAYVIFYLLVPVNKILASSIGIALASFALFILYKQFLRYEEFTPKIFPYKKKTSQNVIGTITPKNGEPKKRVVFSGHYDSARMFNLIRYTRQGYVYFIGGGILGVVEFFFLFVNQLVFTLGDFHEDGQFMLFVNWFIIIIPFFLAFFIFILGRFDKVFYGSFKVLHPRAIISISLCLLYSALVIIFSYDYMMIDGTIQKTGLIMVISNIPVLTGLFFYWSGKGSPGAVDNLTSCAVCVCAAKIINEWRESHPNLFPKDTEVVIALFGSEEAGCRGSEFFASQRADEWNKIDTTCINMESLVESRYQRVYVRENTTNTDLSPEAYNLAAKCSEELGIETHLRGMPGIAGGTDAAGLVKGGLKATSIEGINYKDYMFWYHTPLDNMDMINEKRKPCSDIGSNYKTRNIRCAMENALKTILLYMIRKDQENPQEV